MQQHITQLRFFERYLGKVVTTGGMCVIVLLVVKFFIINVGQVNGKSMEPNFVDDDRFLINKLSYFVRAPKRYDIVQVIDPSQNKLLIKRVIGLPGEVVAIKRGKVFIRKAGEQVTAEQELPERYLKPSTYTMVPGQKDAKRYVVGPDQYFILGDNRPQSGDSRGYGPVARSRILGKVVGKL